MGISDSPMGIQKHYHLSPSFKHTVFRWSTRMVVYKYTLKYLYDEPCQHSAPQIQALALILVEKLLFLSRATSIWPSDELEQQLPVIFAIKIFRLELILVLRSLRINYRHKTLHFVPQKPLQLIESALFPTVRGQWKGMNHRALIAL